jgi:hypothetical protein
MVAARCLPDRRAQPDRAGGRRCRARPLGGGAGATRTAIALTFANRDESMLPGCVCHTPPVRQPVGDCRRGLGRCHRVSHSDTCVTRLTWLWERVFCSSARRPPAPFTSDSGRSRTSTRSCRTRMSSQPGTLEIAHIRAGAPQQRQRRSCGRPFRQPPFRTAHGIFATTSRRTIWYARISTPTGKV